MDTGTHIVTGLGLAGLAFAAHPAVLSDPQTAAAVLVGTLIGSQAPDLDGLSRLKGNSAYIRNHRGWSHSIPAIIGWIAAITLLLALTFRPASIPIVSLWVGIAVCLHVFQDLFNSYGTQMMRPMSNRWISWNIIHIFDPVIFFSQLIAVLLWASQIAPAAPLFYTLYSFLALYYVWRTVVYHNIRRSLSRIDKQYEPGDRYLLTPTVSLYQWNVVKMRGEDLFDVGEYRRGELSWVDRLKKMKHPAVEASRHHPDIAALLSFSRYTCPEVRTHRWGFEVRWVDVRYQHRKQYPFVAVLLMDHQLEPIDSYVGWLSETKLEKRLQIKTQG